MPRAKKAPAFQWYPRDYMADALVISMTLEQEGAYRRLMDICWLENGLPTDLDQLWRLAKAPSRDRFVRVIWPKLGSKFRLKKGRLQHKRLDQERAKQAKTRKARQLAAEKRWKQEGCKKDANAPRLQCSSSSSSSSSSTAVNKKIKSTGASHRVVENGHGENPEGTFGLYCVIAQEAVAVSIRDDQTDSIANITAVFKDLCSRRHLDYDSDIAARSIDAVARKRQGAA